MPKTVTAKIEAPKIPAPLYAAAGAGDIAMENLRKLPGKVATLQDRARTELPGRLTVLQDKVTRTVTEIPALVAEFRQRMVDADADKLRDAARRNTQTVMEGAQVAQEKAAAIYAHLVARGEKVVGRTVPGARPSARPDRIVAEVIATGPKSGDSHLVEATIADKPAKPAKSAKPVRRTTAQRPARGAKAAG